MEEENIGAPFVSNGKPVVDINKTSFHYSNKKNFENMTELMRKNPWILSTIVLGIVTLLLLFGGFENTGSSFGAVSANQAANNIVTYLNGVAESEVTLISSVNDGGLYLVTVGYQGEEIPVYVTKDGTKYTPSMIPIDEVIPTNTGSSDNQVEKSDNPVAELFVMTHCPYGTQAEKGFLPTMLALGDVADIQVRFVHYFLHDPEEAETPRQVCIREEQNDRFLPYLKCFLEDGDSSRCIGVANVDETAMNECIENGNAEGYYVVDSSLSQSYGVRGSPTLVINGAIATTGRDSQSYLDAICGAFNVPPEECLSADVPSETPGPGFGWESVGAAAVASCV